MSIRIDSHRIQQPMSRSVSCVVAYSPKCCVRPSRRQWGMFCIPEDRHGAHAARGHANHVPCRWLLMDPGAPEACDLEVDGGV